MVDVADDDKAFRAVLIHWNPFKPLQEVNLHSTLAGRFTEIQGYLDGYMEVVSGVPALNKFARGSARVAMLVNEDSDHSRSGERLKINFRASFIYPGNIYGNVLLVGLGRSDILTLPPHTTLGWLTEQLIGLVQP